MRLAHHAGLMKLLPAAAEGVTGSLVNTFLAGDLAAPASTNLGSHA